MPEAALRVDDAAQAERAGHHQSADHRQPQRELVTDHLRGRPQPAKQRILAVGGPSGQRDAVHAQGSDGENKEQADIQIGDLKLIGWP